MRFKARTFVLHAVLPQKGGRTKNKNTPPDAQAGVCVNNEISFRIYGAWQHKTYFSSCLCFNPPARSSFIDFNNISMLSRLSFSLFLPLSSFSQCVLVRILGFLLPLRDFSFLIHFSSHSNIDFSSRCLFVSENPLYNEAAKNSSII